MQIQKQRKENNGPINIKREVELKKDHVLHLGSIVHKEGGTGEDAKSGIVAGWLNWRSSQGVLCILKREKFYETAIRPAMRRGFECWAMKKLHDDMITMGKRRMLRWILW